VNRPRRPGFPAHQTNHTLLLGVGSSPGSRDLSLRGCGAELFRSEAKYDSGTGWPSFFEPIARGAVELQEDLSFGMRRIEVTCARCGGHLGHLFDDGPEPTGERHCMNSISLSLEPDDAERDGVVD
jgi:methionine-R-sulfoxide reductase